MARLPEFFLLLPHQQYMELDWYDDDARNNIRVTFLLTKYHVVAWNYLSARDWLQRPTYPELYVMRVACKSACWQAHHLYTRPAFPHMALMYAKFPDHEYWETEDSEWF